MIYAPKIDRDILGDIWNWPVRSCKYSLYVVNVLISNIINSFSIFLIRIFFKGYYYYVSKKFA